MPGTDQRKNDFEYTNPGHSPYDTGQAESLWSCPAGIQPVRLDQQRQTSAQSVWYSASSIDTGTRLWRSVPGEDRDEASTVWVTALWQPLWWYDRRKTDLATTGSRSPEAEPLCQRVPTQDGEYCPGSTQRPLGLYPAAATDAGTYDDAGPYDRQYPRQTQDDTLVQLPNDNVTASGAEAAPYRRAGPE